MSRIISRAAVLVIVVLVMLLLLVLVLSWSLRGPEDHP